MLDFLIDKLTNIQGIFRHTMKKKGDMNKLNVDVPEACVRWLIKESQQILKREPTLLELEAPINICGDFHGQFYDMLRVFEMCGGGPPK